VAFIPGLKHGVRRCALAPPGLSAYHFCNAHIYLFLEAKYALQGEKQRAIGDLQKSPDLFHKYSNMLIDLAPIHNRF
jgi:hypothetical protein